MVRETAVVANFLLRMGIRSGGYDTITGEKAEGRVDTQLPNLIASQIILDNFRGYGGHNLKDNWS